MPSSISPILPLHLHAPLEDSPHVPHSPTFSLDCGSRLYVPEVSVLRDVDCQGFIIPSDAVTPNSSLTHCLKNFIVKGKFEFPQEEC